MKSNAENLKSEMLKTNRPSALILLLLAFKLFSVSAFGQVFNGVYADTNNQILPGYTIAAGAINGSLNPTNFPASYATTNQVNSATNAIGTNAAVQLQITSNTLAAANAYGTNWTTTNCFLLTNLASNYVGTNLLGIFNSGSNYLSTNLLGGLTLQSNAVFAAIASSNTSLALGIQGTSNYVTATSNSLYNFSAGTSNNLVTASNNLYSFITGTSNNVVTSSNANQTLTLSASNSLKNFALGISNLVVVTKAFTAVLPGGYTSQGIAFTTPLMPDGNYSVELTPQDVNTANTFATNAWWVDTKNNAGFTIRISYQNPFNINFECQVKENTQ